MARAQLRGVQSVSGVTGQIYQASVPPIERADVEEQNL